MHTPPTSRIVLPSSMSIHSHIVDSVATVASTSLSSDRIAGNAAPLVKQAFANPAMVFPTLDHDGKYRVRGFAMETVFQRLVVTELSSNLDVGSTSTSGALQSLSKRDEDLSASVRLVCEVDVQSDMVNNQHTLHGGCTAFLIDMCSSLACVALNMSLNPEDSRYSRSSPRPPKFGSVSQSTHVVYHSPAPVGDRLRLVSTTIPLPVSLIGRDSDSTVCIRTEIWSTHHHRLVASGTQNMMPVSSPSSSREHSYGSQLESIKAHL